MPLNVDDLAAWEPVTPRIVGVFVGQYKNLRDVWLPWHRRMVLVGPNGVGKSNVLECCALLMGTNQTRALVARRVPDDLDYDISVVMEEVSIEPGLGWWERLGSNGDESLADAACRVAAKNGASNRLQRTITKACEDGLVRYRLSTYEGTQKWTTTIVTKGAVDSLPKTAVAVEEPLGPLTVAWRDEHPRGTQDQFRDVVELPGGDADDVPVDLQWLPYSRAGREIVVDFNEAVLDAAWEFGVHREVDLEDPHRVASSLIGLLAAAESSLDHNDVLQHVAAFAGAAATSELTRTMPTLAGLQLVWQGLNLSRDCSYSEEDGDWDSAASAAIGIEFDPSGPYASLNESALGVASKPGTAVELMSAGERRWFDEAMHAAAITITDRLTLVQVVGRVVWEVLNEPGDDFWIRVVQAIQKGALTDDQSEEFRLLLDLIQKDQYGHEDYKPWASRTIRELSDLLKHRSEAAHPEPAVPALHDWIDLLDSRTVTDSDQRSRLYTVLQGLADTLDQLKQPRARVRVFDEPEAHLHSGAVGRVADGLTALGQAADVLCSSHHPRFIHQPEWTPFHVHTSLKTGRTTLSRYDPSDTDKRNEVAASLGLAAGETLAGLRAILLVEGLHDEMVLAEPPMSVELTSAGVMVLPVRGVNEYLSELALQFVLTFGTPLVGLMFDNDRRSQRERTPEQRVADRFVDEARGRGLQIEKLGLERPDIICYLNPHAAQIGDSWEPLVAEFTASPRINFKGWLHDEHRIDLRNADRLRAALERMRRDTLGFESELIRKISGFAAVASNAAVRRQLGD